MRRLAISVFLLVVSASVAQASPAPRSEIVAETYDQYSVTPPTVHFVTICHGYGCRIRTEIAVTPADRAQLAKIMAAGKSSAEAERRAVAAAGAWFDKRVGPRAGTVNHVARSGPDHMREPEGQFDCIDASRNTTTLLLLLADLKLLRYHVPDVPVARGYIIDFKLPHATAVLVETASRVSYAVDSWVRAYGQAPEIMPLAHWKAAGGL